MSTPKPTMFIAEDSRIATLYERMFNQEFDVTVAQTGGEAFRTAADHGPFNVCIIDIIMPVESDAFSLADADTTGLRLIEYLVTQHKAERFLVLTVRWDVKDEVAELLRGHHHALLLKGDTNTDEIRDKVRQLMAAGGGAA